jgi:hypothetical protein
MNLKKIFGPDGTGDYILATFPFVAAGEQCPNLMERGLSQTAARSGNRPVPIFQWFPASHPLRVENNSRSKIQIR